MELKDITEALFESATEGIVVVDKLGVIQLTNNRLNQIFGYKSKELKGEKIEILIPDRHKEQHVTHRNAYHKHPTKRSMGTGLDLEGKKKNGTTFPIEISLNYSKVNGENMVIGLLSDITERKKAENAIKELNEKLEERVDERTKQLKLSQHLYKSITKNYPNGMIYVLDSQLCFTFAEGEELLNKNLSGKMLKGTSFLERLPKKIVAEVEVKLLDVFKGKNSSFEMDYQNKTFLINTVGLKNKEGIIDQIIVVEVNISKQKEAEVKVQEALTKERNLNELKSRFVSMASHEFRTPLTTILSSTNLIEKYIPIINSEEKQLKHLNRISKSVKHLTAILNDLLKIDKLETDQLKVNYLEINLPNFMKETIEEVNVMSEIQDRIDYKHIGKKTLYFDELILKNIINNLVSNAIKYSKKNTRIEISTEVNKDNLKIQVKDFGIGIPEEEQSQLFNRFFRARNVANIEGTGLGLSIIKKYLDSVGGSISFQSQLNIGTTFTVNIPIQ